jgi:hypothetical protein
MRSWRTVMRGAAVTAVAALAAGVAALPAGASPAAGSPAWRARTALPLATSSVAVAVDPQAGLAYQLVGRTPADGPYRLERTTLSSGHVIRGAEFRATQLTLAGGYVWVSGAVTRGQTMRLVLNQVSPTTLRVIRSWRLTGEEPLGNGFVPVATGPGGTVWTGFQHTLWRLSTRTGTVVARAGLRSSLFVDDLAVDPARTHLYLSAAPNDGGAAMREYAAGTGRLLASAGGKPLEFSVYGAELTAAPSRVWASFRTGMAGQTIALRRQGLSLVHFTGGTGLFGWFMEGSTSYGAGSVWLGLNNGDAGCVAPSTGAVRSRGHLRLLTGGGELLGVSAARHVVYAAGEDAILAISAPATCWR